MKCRDDGPAPKGDTDQSANNPVPSTFVPLKLESIGSASLLAYLPDRAVTHYGRAELEDDDTGQQHVSDLFERIIIDRKTRFGETTDR